MVVAGFIVAVQLHGGVFLASGRPTLRFSGLACFRQGVALHVQFAGFSSRFAPLKRCSDNSQLFWAPGWNRSYQIANGIYITVALTLSITYARALGLWTMEPARLF
jgi:hypothetical protein